MNNDFGKPFGQRGVASGDARARNPYTGMNMPVRGQAKYDSVSGVDESLRTFMLRVYNLMAGGLAVTSIMAFVTYWLTVTGDPALAALYDDNTPLQITKTEYLTELGALLWATPLGYAVTFAPLFIILFTSAFFRKLGSTGSFIAFMLIAGFIGISFSGLALTYTNGSIAQMFFATAAGFGGLSLAGYTTHKDLSGMGSFLWMGFFGLLAACISNIFLHSDALHFAISVVGVLVFSGFTAYDTQMIKQAYTDRLSGEDAKKLAIRGALDLYLDFINLFRFLLALFGSRE